MPVMAGTRPERLEVTFLSFACIRIIQPFPSSSNRVVPLTVGSYPLAVKKYPLDMQQCARFDSQYRPERFQTQARLLVHAATLVRTPVRLVDVVVSPTSPPVLLVPSGRSPPPLVLVVPRRAAIPIVATVPRVALAFVRSGRPVRRRTALFTPRRRAVVIITAPARPRRLFTLVAAVVAVVPRARRTVRVAVAVPIGTFAPLALAGRLAGRFPATQTLLGRDGAESHGRSRRIRSRPSVRAGTIRTSGRHGRRRRKRGGRQRSASAPFVDEQAKLVVTQVHLRRGKDARVS